MTAFGPGGGIGGVGGGRPPQPPANKPRIDKVRLVTCLTQKLVDLLGARGFTVRQYGDVMLFRERGIEYLLRLKYKKGEELAAQLVIGDKSCSLYVYEKNMAETEEAKLVENLKEILIGEVRKLEAHYYWGESGLIPLLDKYKSELLELAAKPILTLDGPWPKPLTAQPEIKQKNLKPDTAAPAKENGTKAVLADTLPHPVLVPSHERITKPIEYLSSLIQGKGKDAKLMFTSEYLMEALKRELEGVQSISVIETKPGAQNATVEIKVGDNVYRLSVTPLIASLSCQQGEVNLSLIKTLASIFGRFDPRPGRKHYICTINWTKVEAQLGERLKSVMGKAAESQRAVAEKLALEKTEPGPLSGTRVSPTAKTAPIKTEYEEAVKKWAQSQLVEWLKAKFHEFKLEEMAFSFSEGRVNISVKAAHQIFVKKEVDSRGVTNRILSFSLSVGEFGAFVRQIIPDHRDLRLLQEALVNLGKSKQSYVSLHYPNLNIERFRELIGKC